MDNVIPNVGNGGEEEKVEWEPRKMLGTLNGNRIDLADIQFSAHTNRVAVIDGHTVCASVELSNPVDPEIAIQACREFTAHPIGERFAFVTAARYRGPRRNGSP